MGGCAVRVTCLRCRNSRNVELESVLFSLVHFAHYVLIRCSDCHRVTLHVLGREGQKDSGIKVLGGGGR